MKADRRKLELAMARACLSTAELTEKASIPRSTVNGIISGKSAKPGTIGKIAKALEVDVTEIIED
ncbi:MAG: helix-turn-helix transcriptional regulator [Lachnospiraceae bacterium]|nr:helix-turn-helix transcriptional regulator [Lachnospiraceae bacterium]